MWVRQSSKNVYLEWLYRADGGRWGFLFFLLAGDLAEAVSGKVLLESQSSATSTASDACDHSQILVLSTGLLAHRVLNYTYR